MGSNLTLLRIIPDVASLALGQQLDSKPGLGLVTWVGREIKEAHRAVSQDCWEWLCRLSMVGHHSHCGPCELGCLGLSSVQPYMAYL